MLAATNQRVVEILLVEDSDGDVRLFREALRDEAEVQARLSVADDGDVALAFLRREGIHAAAPRPDIVLLDLGLPRKDGRAVLREMRSDYTLSAIPVAILTASPQHRAILRAEALPTHYFLAKPIETEPFHWRPRHNRRGLRPAHPVAAVARGRQARTTPRGRRDRRRHAALHPAHLSFTGGEGAPKPAPYPEDGA